MDLKTFISETLIQVVEGVKEAEMKTKAHGAEIAPKKLWDANQVAKKDVVYQQGDGTQRVGTEVNFNVSIQAGGKDGSSSGIGVVTGIFGVGKKGETEATKDSVHRIEFTVTVLL